MLNKKYGYKNRVDPSVSTASQIPADKIKNNTYFDKSLLSNTISPAMLNSPAFMSTMNSMLQSMSHKGYNVNAIISQMPNILGGFDSDKNGDWKNGHGNSAQQFNSKQSSGKHFQHNSFASNNKGPVGDQRRDDTALLPNPVDYQNEDAISKAFCSYLSNFPLEKACGLKADMSLEQINKLLNDSGILESFNATLASTSQYNNIGQQTGSTNVNNTDYSFKQQQQWLNNGSNNYPNQQNNEFYQSNDFINRNNNAYLYNQNNNHNFNYTEKQSNYRNNNHDRKFSEYNNHYKSRKKF